MAPGCTVAILGATSQIAQDFILQNAKTGAADLRLYARRPEAATLSLAQNGLAGRYPVRVLTEFGNDQYDAVLNFVGMGDPSRARAMGAEIFAATRTMDLQVLDYVGRNPETRYIFLSSGAAYGVDFSGPADTRKQASVPINALPPQHYYQIAKLYAEALHRSTPRTIMDIRIFNYFSRSIDLNTRFLICDIANAIRNASTFRTDDQDIVRDYLHPADFFQLVQACMAAPEGTNLPVDAYTQAPITKMQLIECMRREFGLHCEIVPVADTVNATGRKSRYYSTSRTAKDLGYEPRHSSESGIMEEMKAIFAPR